MSNGSSGLRGTAPADDGNGFSHSVMTRTAGFNSPDIAALNPESLFVTDLLMFIGGGAGSAGGIEVTTFGPRRSPSGRRCAANPAVNVG